jgi:hypothetical protein
MSTIDRIGIRHVDVERTTIISAQPFDVVVSKLAAAIGHPNMSAFSRAVAGSRSVDDLERVVNAATGDAGLMEMAREVTPLLRSTAPSLCRRVAAQRRVGIFIAAAHRTELPRRYPRVIAYARL